MSTFHAEIAGLRIDFMFDGPAPHGLERWFPFECRAGGEQVAIALVPGPEHPVGRLTGKVVLDGSVWRPGGFERLGWLDPVTGNGVAPGTPNMAVADTLARFALARSVAARGGVLLHASALSVDGQAHVFPARSGSGKSTLAALGGHVLSDELVAVLPGAGGGAPMAHGTPWWTSHGGAAPLAGVYRLSWGSPAIRPLSRPAMLRHLAHNLVMPFEDAAERARAFAASAELARTTSFAELSFALDTDVDPLIRSQDARRAA